jgi:hypothetical protein
LEGAGWLVELNPSPLLLAWLVLSARPLEILGGCAPLCGAWPKLQPSSVLKRISRVPALQQQTGGNVSKVGVQTEGERS